MRPHRLTAAIAAIRADAGHDSLGPCLLRIEARADASAEVMIYGTIGDSLWCDSVSPSALAEQIGGITAGTIHVRINSGGGVAADGIAIYNALKQHKARKVVYIDGQAASIASLIAMAGDEVVMYATSLLMVHAPHTIAAGNAAAFRQFAEALDTHANAMVEAYAAKTGKRDEVMQLLTDGADHWYTGAQAVEFGFADTIADAAVQPSESARAVALTSYLAAVQVAPNPFAKQLRGQIAASLTPSVFSSLPEVTQTALVAHIEDPTMQQQYLRILANVHANAAPPPAPSAPTPAPAPAPAPNPAPAPVVAVGGDAAAAVQAALAGLRTRNADIQALAQPHMANAEVRAYVEGVIAAADANVTADNVGRHILALLANGAGPLNGGGHVVVAGPDQRDQTRTAMGNAIEARAGMAQLDAGNPYRGMTMAELARESLVQAGVNVRGMDRREIVGLSFTHSSSDFPALLGDAARRSVMRGYEEAEEQIDQFTRPVSVPDFKPTNLVGLGAFSDLLVVPEGGEFKYGTFSEQSQAMKIVTYGRLFSITRQAIINDDLGIFNEVPRKLGQAARRTIAKAVFDLINSNPVLADGHALFSAEHRNLLTAAAISTTSVDAMRVAMGNQRDADGHRIRVPMKSLLTPLALGGLARTVRESQTEVSGGKNLTAPNIVRNTFDVIDDGRLDDVSATAWYGIANPAFVDGIVIGYLDGNQTPYLEQEEGFTVDGVAWKVRLDAAPAIADYRGIYKNPGQ
ncbi:ClpP-like prohead protease/major capsid protein fusion protein [Xanthomonas sp. XNM01]|uniref:ClpP-like prohead protease/major capsid protein fusion protein n=1 Tax=Xanthomonas sp. XNM01 TaxID=2769289 RepID=UPI00177D3DF4|nr:ClpP-like prohead protease/major capsid protein fusion protein [Xanthomonas sp. XNM01]MBD9368848.1 Clp protease ClpP [Xanthomonas sp. XNM01]